MAYCEFELVLLDLGHLWVLWMGDGLLLGSLMLVKIICLIIKMLYMIIIEIFITKQN